MFYNFVEYLKTQFPTETIYSNGRMLLSGQEVIPDRNVLVSESGGSEQPWTLYQEKTVQVIARDESNPEARELAHDIFEDVTSRFGLILPAVTVNGTTYPAVAVAQISAIQPPYWMGVDDEGRNEYVNNYKIIYRR